MLVDNEVAVVIFISDLQQLLHFAMSLCTVCDFPVEVCVCRSRHQPEGRIWSLFGERTGPISTNRELAKAVSNRKEVLHMSLDFEEPIPQAKKSYETMLCEPEAYEPMVKCIEDMATLIFQMKRSRNIFDVTVAVGVCVRSLTGRSNVYFMKDLTLRIKSDFSEYFAPQSDGHWTSTLSDVYDNYSRAKESKLAKRLKAVFNHIVMHCVYHKLGIEVDPKLFSLMEERKIKATLKDCVTFGDAMVGLTAFLLKHGRQCMIAKSFEPLFLDGDSVSEWLVDCKQLKVDFEFLGNPEAAGISIHSFLNRLDKSIEASKSISKYLKAGCPEQRVVLGMSMELDTMKKRYLSVSAAQKVRKQPLGVVIFGNPGVGKSSVMEMLFHYDAIIRGRDPDPSFKFQFPADSDHFDNFKSWQHTIVLDDVAQHNPAKLQGVDPTTGLVLRIGNNQSFCPPQAALEDKGKTPMLVDLMLVTTNTRDMNLPIYYPASYAAMRRIPIHIEPVVKEQYRKPNSTCIDPDKTGGEGVYPNFWNFKVSLAQQCGESMVGKYEFYREFEEVSELLSWFKIQSDTHHKQQTEWLANQLRYADQRLCECGLPDALCECITVEWQAGRSRIYDPNYDSDVTGDESKVVRKFCEIDPEDIFRLGRVDHTRPWRSVLEIRKPRTCTFELCYRFLHNHERSLVKKALAEYAFEEIPVLMAIGATNAEIVEDFEQYVTLKKEEAEILEQEEMIDLLCETTREKVGIKSDGFRDRFLRFLITGYFTFSIIRRTARFFGRSVLLRRWFMRFMRPALIRTDNQKFFMKRLGRSIDERLGGKLPAVITGLGLLSVFGVLGVLTVLWKKFSPNAKKADATFYRADEEGKYWEYRGEERLGPWMSNGVQMHMIDEKVKQTAVAVELEPEEPVPQVSVRSVGHLPKPASGDDKRNPWKQEERIVTTTDFLPNRVSNEEAFMKRLLHNTLRFVARGRDEGGAFRVEGSLLVLSNECFVTNNHSLPHDAEVELTVSFDGHGHVRPDVTTLLRQSQISRIPLRDICVVTTRSLPALFKDISVNFVRSSFAGRYDGFYLIRSQDGSIHKHDVFNIHSSHYKRSIGDMECDMEVFSGVVETPTEVGHCGSPLVLNTGYGPVIVGFHALYFESEKRVMATKFTLEDYTEFSSKMDVQVGRIPVPDDEIEPGSKSYVDYHDDGKLMYHGELKGFRARPKHTVVESELAHQLYGKTVCGQDIARRLTGPVMDNWRPQQVSLAEFIKPVDYMDEVLLDECVRSLKAHILSQLPKEELDLLHVYPLDVAVNGFPGMAYVDPIKRGTSMGFPHRKPKRDYMIPMEGLWPNGVKFKREIEEIIETWHENYTNGVRCHPVFAANLKNEPVSFKKAVSGKTRVFFSGPASLLVLVRMYFMSFARVVQRNRDIFSCAVGMNTTSLEWDKLFHRLARFGIETTIAGDYAFFDKKVKMLLVRRAMELIIGLCEESGNFSEQELLVMKGIMLDLMNPTVDFFGMLMTLLGGEVSGHQLTTIFNCVVNLLYLIYSYGKCGYDVKDFFDNVEAVVLGDDHVACVSPERPLFTHTHIKSVMLGLGVDYTMADKESESVPYISLHNATFLKRSFKYSPDLGVYVGPLEVESIFKMLTIQTASKTISLSEQLAQAICSASMESFFHGEEFFKELNGKIDACVKSYSLEVYMKDYPRFSYGVNLARFWSTDTRDRAFAVGPQSQKQHSHDSYCQELNPVPQSSRRMGHERNRTRAIPEICFYRSVEFDTKRNLKEGWHESATPHEKQRLSQTNEQSNNQQSDVPETEGSVLTTLQQTTYVNETVPETLHLGTPHDPTADSQVIPAHLADFLSRPAKIATYTWTENAPAGTQTTFYPWELYFNNANIKNKLQNFGLMRCTLKVKFTINASQFYYGSLGAFYSPLSGYAEDTTGASRGFAAGTQILQSQKPHVWLDPQSTSTSEMELPFFFHRNWLDTRVNNTLRFMGKIDLSQFAALRSANGVTTAGVNIVVYAWAENVELTAPTSAPILQSKKEYRKDGQISGPASTVAKAAGMFRNVPIVGDFAKATEMAAGAVGSMASFFGFTNVPNVRDIEGVKSVPFHTLASSEISEPINKLSLQPKQEVSISTTMLGDDFADQLHIANFCQRESFLAGALWSTADPEDKILFTSGVTPELYSKSSGTNYNLYNTPMAHVSRLFTYWRGDIIFRFKLIKTQYHRGRINVCWDAMANVATAMPGYGNPAVMNMVFDLEDSDELEVRVPYVQALPFVKMTDEPYAGLVAQGPYWSNGATPTFSGRFNGVIQVRVINRLTAPEASSDVDLLVFVRAADNIEFAQPTDLPQELTRGVLQSKKTYDTQCFGNPTASDPKTYDEVFGERIVSMRELLHRQSKCWTQSARKASDWSGQLLIVTIPFQRLPREYGYATLGWESGESVLVPGTFANFNYVRNHPVNWVTGCFLGYKGSMNYNFNAINLDVKGQRSVPSVSVAKVAYASSGQNFPRQVAIVNTKSTAELAKLLNCNPDIDRSGATGMALTNQVTQAGLAVNLPYYSRSRFLINDLPSTYSLTAAGDEKNLDWFELTLKRGAIAGTADIDLSVDIMCGTGPDFNLIFFINCPVLAYLPPPVAAAAG